MVKSIILNNLGHFCIFESFLGHLCNFETFLGQYCHFPYNKHSTLLIVLHYRQCLLFWIIYSIGGQKLIFSNIWIKNIPPLLKRLEDLPRGFYYTFYVKYSRINDSQCYLEFYFLEQFLAWDRSKSLELCLYELQSPD